MGLTKANVMPHDLPKDRAQGQLPEPQYVPSGSLSVIGGKVTQLGPQTTAPTPPKEFIAACYQRPVAKGKK